MLNKLFVFIWALILNITVTMAMEPQSDELPQNYDNECTALYNKVKKNRESIIALVPPPHIPQISQSYNSGIQHNFTHMDAVLVSLLLQTDKFEGEELAALERRSAGVELPWNLRKDTIECKKLDNLVKTGITTPPGFSDKIVTKVGDSWAQTFANIHWTE